jgi:hypothetical protein
MRALLRASSSAASSSSIQAASSAKSIEDGSWAEQSRGRRAAGCSAVVRGGGRERAAYGRRWCCRLQRSGAPCAEAVGDRRPRGRSGTGSLRAPAVGNGRPTGAGGRERAAYGRRRWPRAAAVGIGIERWRLASEGCEASEGIRSWAAGQTRQTGTPFFFPKN